MLLQRAGQGRDELELRRLEEAGRRAARFRVVAQDLAQLHALEVAHLENFLEGQVCGGWGVLAKDACNMWEDNTRAASAFMQGPPGPKDANDPDDRLAAHES